MIWRMLGRLFGALPYRSRMRAGMKQASALLTKYPPISPRDVIQCLKKNPFEALLDLSQTPGGLDTLANIRPHLSRPTEIRLRTTRGGLWIERRDVVEGGPEYALSDLQDHTLAKFEQVWGAGSDWHAHQLIHPNSTWSAHRVLNLERHP